MSNKKLYGIVMSCLAAVFISVPVAFIMVVINVGFTEGFLLAFLKSTVAGTLISIPLANISIPLAEKITRKIVKK